MKPKPDEAQNTKFSWEERSLLICGITFKISKFEKWPHPVCAKIKMDFHVSLGFHGSTNPNHSASTHAQSAKIHIWTDQPMLQRAYQPKYEIAERC